MKTAEQWCTEYMPQGYKLKKRDLDLVKAIQRDALVEAAQIAERIELGEQYGISIASLIQLKANDL